MVDRKKQTKVIWGMAKDLGMEKEDVYTLLYRETEKESMTECTERELSRVIQAMILIKEKRTNCPGKITGRQRYKIKELERALGWADDKKRLEGFIKKYYHVDRLDWLSMADASNLIEALKKLADKEKSAEAVMP